MPRLASLTSSSLAGLGITVEPGGISFNGPEGTPTTYTGTLIGLGTNVTGTNGDLTPAYATTSPDSWTNAPTVPATFASDTNWDGNNVVASSGTTAMVINSYTGRTAITTDGQTWTEATRLSPNNQTFTRWNALAYDGSSRWVTVLGGSTLANGNTISYSDDNGTSWTNVTVTAATWGVLAYGNGRFVCAKVTSPNSTLVSTDGATWTTGGAVDSGVPTQTFKNCFFFAGGDINKFFWIRENDTDQISYTTSDDGVTWTTAATATATGITIFSTPFSAAGYNRIVMIVTLTNTSWYSDDLGATWTAVSNPFTTGYLNFTGLFFLNGLFVATAKTASSNTGTTYISYNGITWHQGSSSTGINNGGHVTWLA